MAEQGNIWADYHRHWLQLRPPLRPDSDVVAAVRRHIGAPDGPTLLMGVTRELADVTENVVAIDSSDGMIAHIWPGDTSTRRAVKGDWRDLPFPTGHFTAAVGDAVLNMVEYPADHERLYASLARALRSGAPLATRVCLLPDPCEPVAALLADGVAESMTSFHGFKWRFAMAVTAEAKTTNIPVRAILDAFDRVIPDRDAFARRTGWPRAEIDTVDAYKNSASVYCFPTARQVLAAIPHEIVGARFQPAGNYDLAERCPVLVATRR